jgi:cytochrome P450
MSGAIPSYEHDIFTDEVLLDPYEHYRALRELGPVVWLEAHQMYVLPRYAELRAALNDADTFASGQGVGLNDFINTAGVGSTLMSDGEPHMRYRNLLFGPLTPKALVPMRESVQATAHKLVEDLVTRASFDAVTDLARALPLSVVPDLIGWPEHGREHLLTWASASFDALGPMNQRAERAVSRFGELFEFAIRTAAEGDFIPGGVGSRLLEAVASGELPAEKAPILVVDYLAPSMDTTISAIGSAVWLLARHPEQWDALREDASLIPRAFNEVIRYESPIRCFSRVVTTDTEVGGFPLAAGSRVMMLYASANRDERYWERADEFDVRRPNVGAQLGLGFGVHNCPGQGLARIETQAILTALTERVDKIVLGEPVRGLNNLINCFTSLPVTVSRA